MEQNKMTPTPWISGGSFPYKGNEGYIFATSMRPEVLVCKTFGSSDENCPPLDEQLANSAAIVSAINGTYGKGIDPSAVGDLLSSIKELRDQFAKVNKFYSKDHEILGRADAAIEKATIKKTKII